MGGDDAPKLPLIARKSIRDAEQGPIKEYLENIREALKAEDWNVEAPDWSAMYHALPDTNNYKKNLGETVASYFQGFKDYIVRFAADEMFVETLNDDVATHTIQLQIAEINPKTNYDDEFTSTKVVDKKLVVTMNPKKFGYNCGDCGKYLEKEL